MTRRSMLSPANFALFLGILCLVFLVPSSSAHRAVSSEPDGVELICHTDNPAECYPKVFQATNEFQPVHEDQEVPKGLHVRMDIYTGKREAKLYDPSEDNDAALKDLPVDSGVIVVEPEQPSEEEESLPHGAPKYQSYGRAKPPEKESPESNQFYSSLEYIKKGPGGTDLPLDEALEFLEEISHDVYYGEKIAENPDTVQALLCLMTNPGDRDAASSPDTVPNNQQAAVIIGSALQNNPPAVESVNQAWEQIIGSVCPSADDEEAVALRQRLFGALIPARQLARDDTRAAAALSKARVGAVSSLLRSKAARDEFIRTEGLAWLGELLGQTDAEWDAVHRKIGHLLLDNFLDEEAGATRGLWPVRWASIRDGAQRRRAEEVDVKWMKALKAIRERHRSNRGHWSSLLLLEMEANQKKQLEALPRDEL